MDVVTGRREIDFLFVNNVCWVLRASLEFCNKKYFHSKVEDLFDAFFLGRVMRMKMLSLMYMLQN